MAWRRRNPDFICERRTFIIWTVNHNNNDNQIMKIQSKSKKTHDCVILPATITPPELLDYSHWTPQSEEIQSTKYTLRLVEVHEIISCLLHHLCDMVIRYNCDWALNYSTSYNIQSLLLRVCVFGLHPSSFWRNPEECLWFSCESWIKGNI